MFLEALFGMAIEDRILINSPTEKLAAPKRSKPIRYTPTLEEFHQIVAAIRSEKYSDTAEASALCWRDVNFEKCHLLTFRQKTRKGFSIPFFPQLRPLLERRLLLSTEKTNSSAFDCTPGPNCKRSSS